MSADQPDKDPRDRMAELFEQRLRQGQGEPPAGRGGGSQPPRRPVRSPEPPPDALRTSSSPAPGAAADGQVMQRYLQDLERRLAEVSRREQELAAKEQQQSQHQAESEANGHVVPLPASPPVPRRDTAPEMQQRLADLEQRLTEVTRREQQTATLEQLTAFQQQLSRRMEALSSALRPPAAETPPTTEPPPPHPDQTATPLSLPDQATTPLQTPDPTMPADGIGRGKLVLWMAVPLVVLALLALIVLAQMRLGAAQNRHAATGIVSSSSAVSARPSPVATVATAAGSSVTSSAATSATSAPAAAAAATAAATTSPATPATPAEATSASTASAAAVSAAAGPLRLAGTMTVGQSLCDLAVDAGGQHLYVTDDGPEQLLVIDPAMRQVTRRFSLQDSLCSIALDEAGHTVYAPTWHRTAPGQYDASRIQAVDLATGTIRTFADDRFPTGPFFDPRSRRLYVGNTAEPSVAVINAGNGATDTWPLAARVNRIAVSTRIGRLYLAGPDDNRLLVVDAGTHAVLATLSVGQRPWGVAADAGTGNVLVSSELSNSVSLIDPQTNQVVRTTTVGSHPRNLVADGIHGRFYVLNAGDRTVTTLDAQGNAVGTSARLPDNEDLTGLAVAAQTGQVYVASKTHIYALQ